LWEVYSKKPSNWLEVDNAGLKRLVGGFVQTELIPSFVSTSKYGTISINRWGLRDRDYDEKPAAGTLRAAVLGASSVMGWGVGDGATFEALLEDRLNREPLSPAFQRVELLNYGVPGYQPPQQVVAFDKSAALRPNAVLYVATGREMSRSVNYLAEALRKNLPLPMPALQAIVQRAGAQPGGDETQTAQQLHPHGAQILQAVYQYIGDGARARGMRPVWVFLPQVREGAWQEETEGAMAAARAAGFAIVDLSAVYRGRDIDGIRLAEWDDHPNTLGHRLVADALYQALAADPALLFGAAQR
jgi:hypothetical protein